MGKQESLPLTPINTNTLSNQSSSDNYHYMWIDKNIQEQNFEPMYYTLFNEQRKCLKFNTVEKGIEKLFELKYEITIIISGSFFPKFFKKFEEKIKNSEKELEFPFPIVVVFCMEKDHFIANLKANKNFDKYYLLNEKLIFNIFDELVDYINGKKKRKF